MNGGGPTERHLAEWAWFLIALGAVLRFQGLDWDGGLLFNPDERNIAVAAAKLAFPSGLVPQFHAYNGLALYLPRLAAEVFSPLIGGSGSDPAAVAWAGRLLSALFSSLTLPLLWFTARRTLGSEAALFVTACAAAAPALIQSAHFATTEAGLVLCLTFLVFLCAHHVAGDLPLGGFAWRTGVALGLGFGLKTTVLAFAACPVAAVAWTTLRRAEVLSAVKAGAVAASIALLLGVATTPQLLFAPRAYFDTMRFESGVVRGTADVFWTYQFTSAHSGLFELSQLPWLLGPLVPPLALAGILVLLRDLWKVRTRALLFAAPLLFTLLYAVIICGWHAKFVRYLAPLLPLLILFAAYLASGIASVRMRKILMVATAASTALGGLAQAAIYQYPDPRIAAWEWLVPHLAAGDRLAVEPVDVGPPYANPPAPQITTAVLPLLEPSSPAKLAAIAKGLAESRWMVIASRRHFSVLPRLRERFPEMCGYYRALWAGDLGFRTIATFRRRPALPAFLDPTVQAEETFTVFDSPQVFVLVKTAPLSAEAIGQAIEKAGAGCPPG